METSIEAKPNRSFLSAAICALVIANGLFVTCDARDLFELTVDIPGESASRGFSDIEDFVDQVSNEGFDNILVGYQDDITQADASLNIRGIPASASYAANSPTLVFLIPSVGIDESFLGATRDESQDLFKDWFEGQGRGLLTRLLQELVANTPTDPVAGNPDSLMSTMVTSDYSIASGAVSFTGAKSEKKPSNLIGLGLRYGRSSSLGFKTNAVNLPLNYIIPFESQYAVIIDAPLTYLDIEGADSYHASLGLGLRIPAYRSGNIDWAMTPFVRVGVSGSKNLGSAALVYSGSVTSTLSFSVRDLRIAVNNMFGYYQTDSVEVGDFELDYDLENYSFRNGIAVEGLLNPWDFLDNPITWELAFTDTRFGGDDLFLDQWNEIVFSLGTQRVANQMTWQALRIGAGYTFGNEYDAFRFTLNYRF